VSLATRCTTCGTIFRVAQDQLKASEGWVRCGRCDAVFNSLEGLFDLEREAPPPWTPSPSGTPGPVAEAAAQGAAAEPPYSEREVAELEEEDRIASRFFLPEQENVARSPAESVAERDRVEFADAEFNSDLADDPDAAPAKAPDPTPTFVRRADRDARWQRPATRVTMSLTALLLFLMLGGQGVHHYRDQVAARWPGARPSLETWCVVAGCTLEAPRRIDDIVVESTALTRAAAGTDNYRLSVSLRNRGAQTVALPSIDLSLTDLSGQLVARRALAPADFGQPGGTIAPSGEAPLQVLIATGTPRVSGFTVEVFYP
jgi:predicted Zn finger-like uncharacterized protein